MPLSEIELLKQVRSKIGSRPRSFDEAMLKLIRPKKPSWMLFSFFEKLREQYKQFDHLLTHGSLTWGQIVQANTLLFEPGKIDSPCDVLYPLKPANGDNEALSDMAASLFELKATWKQQGDPELRRFGKTLANETTRRLGETIHPAVTGGRDVRHSAMMVVRKHLPTGYLADGFFPLLIDPRVTGAVTIVPKAFWPDELVALWMS